MLANGVRVEVRSVTKIYDAEDGLPVRALSDASLAVQAGEMVALVGPSGCGKSTMLNLIGCIDLPSSGIVAIDGALTSDLSDEALTALRRDRIGTVFQFFNLLPALTVSENVALPLVLQRVPEQEIQRRLAAVLESVGIADKASALPRQISGGQAQRAAVARAVIHRPAIVLADEPTGNLDSANGEAVLTLLANLAREGQAISARHALARGRGLLHAMHSHAGREDRLSVIFRALVSGHLLENGLRSVTTVVAIALGVAIVLAIDLANATAIASFASSVNAVSSQTNLQIVGRGSRLRRARVADRYA